MSVAIALASVVAGAAGWLLAGPAGALIAAAAGGLVVWAAPPFVDGFRDARRRRGVDLNMEQRVLEELEEQQQSDGRPPGAEHQ